MKESIAFGLWGALPIEMLNANALAVHCIVPGFRIVGSTVPRAVATGIKRRRPANRSAFTEPRAVATGIKTTSGKTGVPLQNRERKRQG